MGWGLAEKVKHSYASVETRTKITAVAFFVPAANFFARYLTVDLNATRRSEIT